MKLHAHILMSDDEAWARYQRMRREAESELQAFVHGLASADDVFDRFELTHLWRMVCEGHHVSEDTWDQMIEATNL